MKQMLMKLKLEGYKQASLAVQKMNYAKDKRNKLLLNVYQKNARTISFYKREGNIVNKERCICYARYTRG